MEADDYFMMPEINPAVIPGIKSTLATMNKKRLGDSPRRELVKCNKCKEKFPPHETKVKRTANSQYRLCFKCG